MKVFSYDESGKRKSIGFDCFQFAGGEEHIRFESFQASGLEKCEIVVRITNSSALIRLLLAVDALKQMTEERVPIELVMPYFPYARQDRVCVIGEAFGAKVMAELINRMQLEKVTIWDAHSDVSPALINRVHNVAQSELIAKIDDLRAHLSSGELLLVSPDAGASKKTMAIAKHFEGVPQVVQAQKIRCPKTGEILETKILGNVSGKRVLIADDICDGGRTFIELAKVLKQQGVDQVYLFVTHGIFSKGIEVFEGLIDKVYTTDSFRPKSQYPQTNMLNVLEF